MPYKYGHSSLFVRSYQPAALPPNNQHFVHRVIPPLSINLLRLQQKMSHTSTNFAAPKSCLECRRRKIKCDRSIPCSYCVKVKIKCCYPAPKTSNKSGNLNLSNEVLSARIDGIESSLQSFEHSISQIWELLQRSHSASSSAGNDKHGFKNRLVGGQALPAERTTDHVCVSILTCFNL